MLSSKFVNQACYSREEQYPNSLLIILLLVLAISVLHCSGNPTGPSAGDVDRKILFSSSRTGNFDLYLMNEDGSDLERLTTTNRVDHRPMASPDGKKVVFSDLRDLWILDMETKETTQITFDSEAYKSADWSPDGSMIAYASDKSYDDNIYIISLALTETRAIPVIPSHITNLDWSPDGTQILYAIHSDIQSIYVLDIESGISEKVVDNAHACCWIDGGDKISYVSLPDYDIVTYDLITKEKTILVEQTFAFTMSWAADGKSLTYTNIEFLGFYDIYTYTLGDTAAVNITNTQHYDRDPIWIEVNK